MFILLSDMAVDIGDDRHSWGSGFVLIFSIAFYFIIWQAFVNANKSDKIRKIEEEKTRQSIEAMRKKKVEQEELENKTKKENSRPPHKEISSVIYTTDFRDNLELIMNSVYKAQFEGIIKSSEGLYELLKNDPSAYSICFENFKKEKKKGLEKVNKKRNKKQI
jgi:uncharacterized membrane protein